MNRHIAPGRLAAEWWLTLVAMALVVCGCLASGMTTRLDNSAYDLALRGIRRPIDPRLLVVAIDDRSLAEIGPWPWPRATQARLIEALNQGAPKAIAYDVLLMEPGAPEGDAALARAIGAGAPVYLPVHFEVPGPDGASYLLSPPLAPLGQRAAGLGHVNLAFDSDGTVRRAFLAYRAGAQDWPQMVTLMAGHAPPPALIQPQAGNQLEPLRPVMIAYAGPQGSLPAISAASVLRGEVPASLLRGRLVLVGATASGLGDTYATPMGTDGSLMPGVEVQAHLLNALTMGLAIIPIDGLGLYALSLLPLVLLHVGLRVLRPGLTIMAIGALVLGTIGAAYAALALGHVWVAPASALVGVIGLYPLWTWRRLVAVSHYMSAELEMLDTERDPLERRRPAAPPGDVVSRQMGLLQSAIDRERDLRHFLVDRIAQMPDAVIVTDLAGQVVLTNAGARRLYADWTHTSAEGPGPAHADALLAHLTRATARGRQPLAFAARITELAVPWGCQARSTNGQSFDVRTEPQRSADGELIGLVIRLVDTTTATLMQRQREDVLQLLSHDMRAPQASIIALLDQNAADLPAKTAERIRRYARRTLQMADDFVHLSRAELMQISFQPTDLIALAQDAVDALWPQAHGRGIALDMLCDEEEDELLVRGEASLLARALINLVDNAVKFTPTNGRVTVQLERAPPTTGRPQAILRVRDTGLGIEKEQLAALFERFRRAPSGPAKGIDGAGMGLAFVHTVVTRHGGTITCASTPGEGTCFAITLPLDAAAGG